MPNRRCAAHLLSSALSGFLPVRPGSRAEVGAELPGLDGQAAGAGGLHAVALGMMPISFSGGGRVVNGGSGRILRPARAAGIAGIGGAQPGAAAPAGDLVVSGRPVGEGAGDGGGPAGDLQQAVDVFQVGAHGSLGNAQAAGDLGVGVPGGDQVQQFPLPVCELGGWVAAALGVEVGLVQVGAQHGEQVAVPAGEIRARARG